MTISDFRKHIVGHAIAAWSHNKPLTTLAILIAESRQDVTFTFLTSSYVYPKIMGELAKLPEDRFKAIENRINVLNVVPPSPDHLKPAVEVIPELEKLYKQSGSITCLTSGTTVDCSKFPSPCVAILDPFANYAIKGIRSILTPDQLPIVTWMSGTAGATLMLWGPEHYGGRGDYPTRLDEEVKNGKSEIEAFGSENVFGPRDEVLQIPGYPAMYDYERKPQEPPLWLRGSDSQLMTLVYRSIMAAEGIITVSCPVLEGQAVEACNEYFQSLGKTHFSIGPMSVIQNSSRKSDAATNEVMAFLDRMQSEFGDNSLLYIAFGSLLWPTDTPTSIFSGFIDEMIATKTPFVIAHPSPITRPTEDFLQKIRAYPYGMELAWAPQEQILSHKATGWFLTHGGWNSIQEALTYNVPLILWPTSSDQPLNACLLSVGFEAAFELIEARTGFHGTKIPYRRRGGIVPRFTTESAKEEFGQLLSDLKGEKGAIVRRNFDELANKVGQAWDANGDARMGLEALLQRYMD